MRSKAVLIGGFIGIIIFVIIGAYFWWLYFLDYGSDGRFSNESFGYGNLVLVDIEGVNATTEESKENGIGTPSYLFRVDNKKTSSSRYTIYLEETPYNLVNVGCNPSTTLTRQQLSYSLKLNGVIIKYGKLSDIKDNILDEQDIRIDRSNNYELRIWINEEAQEWEGKHYHYKVALKEVES